MATREIWSGGAGRQLGDLLGSALLALLLRMDDRRPAYFCSPWITNFSLANNAFRQFSPLVPDLLDEENIPFAQYLAALSNLRPVRIVTTEQRYSKEFLGQAVFRESPVVARLASDDFHEKGILTSSFYIEGSMNLTHSGVHVNGEKVTYHSAGDSDGNARVAGAYLEFDRRWAQLGSDV